MVTRAVRSVCIVATMLVPVLATACLNGSATVVVDDDRSGSIRVTLQASSAAREALRELDLDAFKADAARSGVEIDIADDGPASTVQLVAEFDDVERALGIAEQAGASRAAPLPLFSRFELSEPDEGGWRLDAELAPLRLPLAVLAAELGLGALPLDRTVSMALNVQLPGRLVSSNADSVDGSVATWRLTSLDDPLVMQMRTVDEPMLSTPQLVAVGAGAAILLGLLLRFGARMRSPASLTPIGAPAVPRKRRWRARAVRAERADWSRPAIDEHAADQPVRTVPLPWQDVKPTEADAAGAHIPQAPVHAAPDPVPAVPDPVPAAPDPVPAAPDPVVVAADPVPVAPAPVPAAPEPAAPVAPPEQQIATDSPIPGWYDDPTRAARLRWWDGAGWTEDVQ